MSQPCAPCTPNLQVPIIIQGEDKTLTLRLVSQQSQLPFDITAATQITATFLKTDKTTLVKTLTGSGIVVVSGPGGTFQVLLTPTDTNSLEVASGDGYAGIEIAVTIAGKISKILLPNSIQVYAPLF